MSAGQDALIRLNREIGNTPWLNVLFILRDRATRPDVDVFQRDQNKKDAIAIADWIAGADNGV